MEIFKMRNVANYSKNILVILGLEQTTFWSPWQLMNKSELITTQKNKNKLKVYN